MLLGIIADDLTGASDAASFARKAGLTTLLLNQIPTTPLHDSADVVVLAQKTRSMTPVNAIAQVKQAFDWLQQNDCLQIYFKYCSTFDSTAQGNIGPVTDALLSWLECDFTLLCPALPANGRTVYQGHLFVGAQLLSDSGMKDHPLTPMHEASLLKLMDAQAQGKTGLISHQLLNRGRSAVLEHVQAQTSQGCRYLVCDAVDDNDLDQTAAYFAELPLCTGGSGLVGALARYYAHQHHIQSEPLHVSADLRGVVISGSCSTQTNLQVEDYKHKAPGFALDIESVINDDTYVDEVCDWVIAHQKGAYFPLVYATTTAHQLKKIQHSYGAETASRAIETFNNQLAMTLHEQDTNCFIVAGGETSGAVGLALHCEKLLVGEEISPGVPWLQACNRPLYLAFKSGNFGDVAFFSRAQDILHSVRK